MKVIGLDGKYYNLSIISQKRANASKLHLLARQLLKEIFPLEVILEEVSLPGSKTERRKKPLFADFFVPGRKVLVEVNGEQHSKFNNYFHQNKLDFYMGQVRDADKREWCDINDIKLIELPYNESINEWRERFTDC